MDNWEREPRDNSVPWWGPLAELTGLRGARVNPGWERVRALSIAAVVAALISGLLGWRSRPQQDTPPPPAPRGELSPSAASSGHAVAGLADVWPHAPADLAGV
ncbi:MAG TPA: hypothetical protein VKB37_06220 [Jatrophihabitantaceae bacterium]|nr:hypothetical protein [Jatrophihabitantaceae bacterium]